MPSYANTILSWNDSVATDCKFVLVNNDAAESDASITPITGGWLNTEKARVIKWTQMYMLDDMKTGETTFTDNRTAGIFERQKTWFLDDMEREVMSGWVADITTGISGATFNVDVPPPPRRHGGIYNVRGRKRRSLHRPATNEQKARRLLQRLIGFQRYARYIRDGFVSYQGASGRVYQIFPGTTHMPVWFKGQRVESLCLYIRDHTIPPTDSVVMRLLMLEHSEAEFRAQANVHKLHNKTDQQIIDESIAAIQAMAGRARALAG